MANKSKVQRPKSKVPIPFRALMTQGRNDVHAALQLWGDFPDCNPEHCCDLDWQHVLMSGLADGFEQSRLDECDPLIKALKRKLAITAAACEMWADSLEDNQ
jgi:hypothetical protein